jgi:hypothetical protein
MGELCEDKSEKMLESVIARDLIVQTNVMTTLRRFDGRKVSPSFPCIPTCDELSGASFAWTAVFDLIQKWINVTYRFSECQRHAERTGHRAPMPCGIQVLLVPMERNVKRLDLIPCQVSPCSLLRMMPILGNEAAHSRPFTGSHFTSDSPVPG